MSGQPDSSDDLIAELAKLMASNAKGEASSGTHVVPKVTTAPEGKPVVRIPGLDMPPLNVTPVDGPRPANAYALPPRVAPAPQPSAAAPESHPAPAEVKAPGPEAKPAAAPESMATAPEHRPAAAEVVKPATAESKPAIAQSRPTQTVPMIRIPGMDQPIPAGESKVSPQPSKVDFGHAPAVAPVSVPPLAQTPAAPAGSGNPQVKSFQPKTLPSRPAGNAAPIRFEPRIVSDPRLAPQPVQVASQGAAPAQPRPAEQARPAERKPGTSVPAAPANQWSFSAPRPPSSQQDRHQPGPGMGGDQRSDTRSPDHDAIAALIAADLDAELNGPPKTTAEQPPARPAPANSQGAAPGNAQGASPRPAPVAARPGGHNPQQQPRPAQPAPTTHKTSGLTAKQVPPESDAFFVAPVFGPGGKSEIPGKPASSGDPMDEIESLIGEAVRVDAGQGEPPVQGKAPVHQNQEPPQPQARQLKPAATPEVAKSQSRRAGIKQHDNAGGPNSAEAAILAAAAATGAEVGRIDPPRGDEPAAPRRKFKPARTRRPMSGGARQYVGMAVAGTLLLTAGLGLYWVVGMNRGDPSTAPVLTADSGPVKEVPVAATVAANTQPRSPVLDQIDGVSTSPGDETLAPTQDIDTAAVSASVDGGSEGDSDLATRKVRTVTVRPDGTIVASDDAVAGAEALPVERPNVPAVPGATMEPSDLLTAEPAQSMQPAGLQAPTADPIAAAIAGSEGGQGPAPLEVANAAGSVTSPLLALAPGGSANGLVAPVPMPRPNAREALNGQASGSASTSLSAPATANDQQVDLLAAAPPAAAPVEAAPTAAAYVQLSSQRTEADARSSMRTVAARWGNMFGGSTPEVRRADLGARGIYYRVMLPVDSRAKANQICTDIKTAGGDCFVP